MLVPGSHKANIAIGDVPELRPSDRGSMDGVPGAVHMYMDPGDVLLFVDCCASPILKHRPPDHHAAVYL